MFANYHQAMKKEKKSKISYFQSNFTSTVSVALVLLLLGIVAFMGILGKTFSDELKENIGFNVVLTEDVKPEQIKALDTQLKNSEYVSRYKYISKEEALESWTKDTGENLVDLFGVNPLSAEFEVYVTPDYADNESLKLVAKSLENIECVDNIVLHELEVAEANKNISNMAYILLSVALLLLIISFALINNTVRLTIYSRRFLIHTMKLVGATPNFIRRPFVISNMFNGLIASVVAMVLLIAVYFFLQNVDGALVSSFDVGSIFLVFVGIMVISVLICGVSAFFAADKYIRLNYDDLFKR